MTKKLSPDDIREWRETLTRFYESQFQKIRELCEHPDYVIRPEYPPPVIAGGMTVYEFSCPDCGVYARRSFPPGPRGVVKEDFGF